MNIKDTVAETSPKQILVQQPQYSIHKRCTTLQKEHECNNVPDAAEGKTRTETRKVVIRSSYFQHKSENLKEPNNGHEKALADRVVDVYENTITQDACFRDNHIKDKVMKRKISANDCVKKVGPLTLCFGYLFSIARILFITFDALNCFRKM